MDEQNSDESCTGLNCSLLSLLSYFLKLDNMSTTVSKILISFDEYTRLKDIERKYEELKGNKTDSGKFTRILKIVASVVRVASKMFS